MSKRYLDINSSFRDRKLYPSVSDFVLKLNPGYVAKANEAVDPVLLAFPYETNLLQGGSTFTQIRLSVESSNILNYYVNSWIEINGFFRQVISYDPTLKSATVSLPFPAAYLALTPYTIRYELPVLRNTTSATATNTSQIVLNAGASSTNDGYVGKYVFVAGASPPFTYQWKRIKSYNGTTKVATIVGNFNAIVPIGTVFEIMNYSYENSRPLEYAGTEVGTNNPSCVSINLVNLIVPNLPVKNGYRGTLQNYPFLYVCLYSEKGLTTQQTLVSNTPASAKAIFKVPVTYLQGISFLTLGYTGMVPNISFRLDDDLHFQILLPSGEVLEFDTGNPTSYVAGQPTPADPISQVQAVFEVTQISRS